MEKHQVKVDDARTIGTIEIAPEVIETIAGIAAGQVEGFHTSSESLLSSVNSLLGKGTAAKGVILTEENQQYVLDIYGAVDYGISVPKIAGQIQQKVKEQLLFSCELEIREVNVHINTVLPVKTSHDELFELGDEE